MNELAKRMLKNELQTLLTNEPIDRMLELYEQFANLDTKEEKGIRSVWMENVEGFYTFSDTKVTNHNYLLNSESFLKKVLFVVDEQAHKKASEDTKLCMFQTMDKLGIFKNLPANVKVDRCNPDTLTLPKNRAAVMTYQLRNNSAHTSDEWATSQMLANINAIMLTTITAVWNNREVIQNQINKITGEGQFGITTLLEKTVRDYENEKRNGFVYFPLSWEGQGDDDQNKYRHIEASELSSDRHVLLSAEAGCGKTTSLKNLEYQLAKSYLAGDSNKIPVNIALIDESPDTPLKEIICRKLNVSLSYCDELLEKGIIYLMVDGLNELTSNMELRKKFVVSLESFFRTYPKVYVIVTDRKFSSSFIRVDKTYHLKRMENQDVLSYAKTKAECDAKTLELLEEVLNKPAFKGLEYTPLIVNRLIISLSSGGQVPNDLSELISGYLEALMKREYEEKRDYNAAPGKLDIFLMRLAVEADESSPIDYLRALKICAESKEEYGIDLSSNYGIDLAIQMGILRRVGEEIEFAFEEYQTHYFMKAVEKNVYN